VHILVHLEVAVGGEVVGVGQPVEVRVDAGVAGGGAGHLERGGGGGVGAAAFLRAVAAFLRAVAACLRAVVSCPRAVAVPGFRRGREVCRARLEVFFRGLGLRYRVVHAPTLPRGPGVPSMPMATIEECRRALDRFSETLAGAEGDAAAAAALDRSLSCRITDLDITFVGRLRDGRIEVRDTVRGLPPGRAEIRLTMTGDDLVALVDGELRFARAWGSGRVRLEAGLRDLFRLRKLL
jgi:hypothetical protein